MLCYTLPGDCSHSFRHCQSCQAVSSRGPFLSRITHRSRLCKEEANQSLHLPNINIAHLGVHFPPRCHPSFRPPAIRCLFLHGAKVKMRGTRLIPADGSSESSNGPSLMLSVALL